MPTPKKTPATTTVAESRVATADNGRDEGADGSGQAEDGEGEGNGRGSGRVAGQDRWFFTFLLCRLLNG